MPALEVAAAENAALVVCFVREVALNYKVEAETRLTLDTDPAAQALFADFLEHGHRVRRADHPGVRHRHERRRADRRAGGDERREQAS